MNILKPVVIFGLGLMLANCGSSVQTSSGKDYNRSVPMSEKGIRAAANVEPLLVFPANFCIVKTQQTKMVYSEPLEMKIWQNMASRHVDWGSFREINPAVVNMVSAQMVSGWNDHEAGANEIRLGAARQHCDAVLTYETRKGQGGVAATALLFDVRNGYSYITSDEAGANSQDAVQALSQSVEIAMAELAKQRAK